MFNFALASCAYKVIVYFLSSIIHHINMIIIRYSQIDGIEELA